MLRVSLPYVFELAEQLDGLSRLPDEDASLNDVYIPLIVGAGAIQGLTSSIYAPYLRSSYQLSQKLLAAINVETAKTLAETINRWALWGIRDLHGKYKTVLVAELGSFNTYFVTQHGGYDMHSLLMAGESIFPADLGAKVPEAVIDAREAARALAYEVPTASGFHAFRVTESVLRRYYSHITGGKAQPKVRNIGVYLHALKQSKKGDEKILAALKQMTDLHRNPLIHPEVVLTTEESIATLGIARSVITAMLAVLPVEPPTTTTATAVSAAPS
ncbi:hypothetical protein QIH77_22770 [Bradyrhizobium diazoefficiens]|uniref:hypothetical protein n=1 Tax=Bradyrhizobium diazoefficiens TaxID=1355477 RepID=UPI00272C70BD|nr:hypothetical protein [Bradyrhizobium diazoefficiens]WLA69745.1 hypothetical protein QIH77_22770 [Bradyrhizobium diazoefficiens]